MDLDSLLVQLSESHAIRTGVAHGAENKEKLEMCEHIGGLLPKIAERSTIQPGICGDGGPAVRSEDQ